MTIATEIADKIAATQDLIKAQAKAIVDSIVNEIAYAASGAETNIPGFGEGRYPVSGGTIKDRGAE